MDETGGETSGSEDIRDIETDNGREMMCVRSTRGRAEHLLARAATRGADRSIAVVVVVVNYSLTEQNWTWQRFCYSAEMFFGLAILVVVDSRRRWHSLRPDVGEERLMGLRARRQYVPLMRTRISAANSFLLRLLEDKAWLVELVPVNKSRGVLASVCVGGTALLFAAHHHHMLLAGVKFVS